MKKVFLFVALTTALAGTIVSCGKSTKGKMDGEWNVDSLKSTSAGGNSSSTISIEGTTVTVTNTSGSNTSTASGTVQTAVWNIKKDGTWDRELAYTINASNSTQKTTSKSSGNWDFQSGVGEFKKNERVVFSTLSENSTEITTVGSFSTTSTSSNTYLDGESTEVFVITESKKKSLELESKGANTSSNGSSSSSSTTNTTIKMTLK